MRVIISRSDWINCYYLDQGDVPGSIEVPEEFVREYELVLRDFDNLQGKLAQYFWRKEA